MELKSIYEHMELGASQVPLNANCKILFRHSVRGDIQSGYGREVKLTNEGIELARDFGRNLKCNIGYFASSSCGRNIQTCKEILFGKKEERKICIAKQRLERPQIQNKKLSDNAFEKYGYRSEIIAHKIKTKGLSGFYSIEITTKKILDFIFSKGNQENTVDLFCTHDFQIAIIYACLFDFAATKESLKTNKWPMMLEGMIFWGQREHFWCTWRNETKEFINYLM